VRNQEVIFNLAGQSFFYDPPEGQATGTPTVQVFSTGTDDDGTAETATTGSCSVDAVATTISAQADAGAVTLSLTDATGVAKGRRYLLAGTNGLTETVEVLGVTGLIATLRQPIINTFAAATFKGTRISIAVNAAWVATKAKITDVLGEVWRTTVATPDDWAPGAAGYRLRWSYTVGGIAMIGVSYADLVRYQAKNLVNALDVDRRFPGWIDRIPIDYRADQGLAFIEDAHYAVKLDALADGQMLRRVRNTEVLRELVLYRANLLSVEAGVTASGVGIDALNVARELYRQRYDQLIREPKVPVDNTGGGSNGQAQRLPAWRR
jgi:hypothetical protein